MSEELKDRHERTLMCVEVWLEDTHHVGPLVALQPPEVQGWDKAQREIWQRRMKTLLDVLKGDYR